MVCPERLESSLANGFDGFNEVLAPRLSLEGQRAFLILAEDLGKYISGFIGHVEPDNAAFVRFEPGRTRPESGLLAFNGLDP